MLPHERLDGSVQVDGATYETGEDVALRQDPAKTAVLIGHEHGIGVAGLANEGNALGQAGARTDGHGIPASQDPQLLVRNGRYAARDGLLADVGHEVEV
jgi:hypothetical protein